MCDGCARNRRKGGPPAFGEGPPPLARSPLTLPSRRHGLGCIEAAAEERCNCSRRERSLKSTQRADVPAASEEPTTSYAKWRRMPGRSEHGVAHAAPARRPPLGALAPGPPRRAAPAKRGGGPKQRPTHDTARRRGRNGRTRSKAGVLGSSSGSRFRELGIRRVRVPTPRVLVGGAWGTVG